MVRLSQTPDGVEVAAEEPVRAEVVDRVVSSLSRLRAVALNLMLLYLRAEFRGEVFWLDSVEVFAHRTETGEDAVLSFSYSPPETPEAEGYTRFEVFVRVGTTPREESLRAVRFAVGFH